MKILKYLLYFFLLVIIIFLAFGLLKPQVEYGHEIFVEKPVEEAWAVAQDETKYAQWLDGFQSIELIEGEYGKVGSKYKVVVKPDEGQDDFEMIETVISKQDFDHVTMHFDSEMMDFDQTIKFSKNEGKTSVKTLSAVTGKGIVMRSMFAMMEILTNSFEKQEIKNIEALKKVIQENNKDYYPQTVENNEAMPDTEEDE